MQANEKVQTIKIELQRLNIVMRHGDKLQKIGLEKLRLNFQDVVEMYSNNQKVGQILCTIDFDTN